MADLESSANAGRMPVVRLFAVICVLAAGLVAGCGGDDDERKSGSTKAAQFEVKIPGGWFDAKDLGDNEEFRDEVEKIAGEGARSAQYELLAASRDPVDEFAANLNVVKGVTGLPESLTPREYEQRARRELEALYEQNPGLRGTDAEPIRDVKVGGSDAAQTEVTRELSGRRVRQRQIFVIHEGTAFVITYTALVGNFEKELGEADQLLASWRWK